MTDKPKGKRRKTLYVSGRHGDTVRALIDTKRDRVEVLYRDLDGVRRKRIFPNDEQGRSEATAWADTFKVERELMRRDEGRPKPITTRALWLAYLNSPAWTNLRAADAVRREGRLPPEDASLTCSLIRLPDCHGKGRRSYEKRRCPRCGGKGVLQVHARPNEPVPAFWNDTRAVAAISAAPHRGASGAGRMR